MSRTAVTLARGRLASHPLWARALAAPGLAARLVLPVVVASGVEDREPVEGVPGAAHLERLSLTEVVREARRAAQAGIAGLLVFGAADRKDEHGLLASQRDHIVARAVRAVKEAVPDLAVMTDVCVCAYTAHGQCVLFSPAGGADVAATLERVAEIAIVHADAGADLVLPSSMLDGTVAAVRAALDGAGHTEVPIAAMAKLESVLYEVHRRAMGAVPLRERAVPLLAADDAGAARARALRDLAAGADAIVVKPGTLGLDVVAVLAREAAAPIVAYHTADEHVLLSSAADGDLDGAAVERESIVASRRAGATLVVTYGAVAAAEAV